MNNTQNLKTIIIGATGIVGLELIDELLNSNQYSQITLLIRKVNEKWNNYTNDKKTKLKIIIKENFNFLSEIYEIEELEKIFPDKPYNSLFNLLGSNIKPTEEEFKKVEFDFVINSCEICEKLKIPHFIFCSNNKADKNSLTLCNKIKGETEEEILKRNIDCVSIFKPGIITDKEKKESKFGNFFNKYVPFVEKLKSNDLAKAMCYCDVLFWKNQLTIEHVSQIFNNNDILKMKDQFVLFLKKEEEKKNEDNEEKKEDDNNEEKKKEENKNEEEKKEENKNEEIKKEDEKAEENKKEEEKK